MKVAVIIPTYNEKENIRRLIPKIEAVFKTNHILGQIFVVDDNSPDGTKLAAELLAKVYRNIQVISRSSKMGIGSAYKEGFKHAIRLGNDILIEMDADLSHNPRYIPDLLSKLEEGYDIALGSRYAPRGGIRNWSFIRRLVSKGANFLAIKLLRLHATDATGGYRAYRRNVLAKINLSKIKSDGYAFQVDMIHSAQKKSFKIGEVPIIFVDRTMGKSKLGKREIINFAKFVLSNTLR